MRFQNNLFNSIKTKILAVLLLGVMAGWAQNDYSINTKESSFTYYMHHKLHSWSATSRAASGAIQSSPDWKSADISVKIPVLSFDSHNRNRDSHMGEVIESYIFHDVIFKGKVVALDSLQSVAGNQRFIWKVAGQLTFHGVTRPLEVPVQCSVQDNQLQASGEFNLKLTDFDIKLPSLLGMKVKDSLRMVFNVVADQKLPGVANRHGQINHLKSEAAPNIPGVRQAGSN